MLFFVISLCSFALLLSKSLLPLHPLPSWASETRLLSVFSWRELLQAAAQSLSLRTPIAGAYSIGYSAMMPAKRRCEPLMDAADESENSEMSILDLPELALECILEKLPPAGLSSMARVCSSLRERCRSDYLWERHMREKWGRVVGRTARREWRLFLASRKDDIAMVSGGKLQKARWIAALSCVWPVSWLSYKIVRGAVSSKTKDETFLPDDSIMSWYQSLEGGKFWFPAQVYNREHGHVGFMLSCYDAEVSYDCHTDTFHARYPPHGRRTIVIEEGVQWDRLRAPPVDTPAHDLHISDCMNDLCPGDHIEIQWRRNKEFPYGWWYGVVGHLESCDGNTLFCRCHQSNTLVLEFNQYTPGSRWRTTSIDRINHREEGNETDGFYGGIRKLRTPEEIAKWRQLWPTDVLE